MEYISWDNIGSDGFFAYSKASIGDNSYHIVLQMNNIDNFIEALKKLDLIKEKL